MNAGQAQSAANDPAGVQASWRVFGCDHDSALHALIADDAEWPATWKPSVAREVTQILS